MVGPVSPAAGTHSAPLVSKGSAHGDPGAREPRFLALPYGWPSGECVLVFLTPTGRPLGVKECGTFCLGIC